MPKRKEKPEYLHRTDHRLDLSPVGRNLFVSRDKQAQDRAARKLKAGMRVVVVLLVLLALAAGGMAAAFYLVPWFRAEILTTAPGPGDSASSELPEWTAPDVIEYDAMGLPVYGDEICLFTINTSSPAERNYVPELTEEGGVQVSVYPAEALRAMMAAAREDGLSLVFEDGYVSYSEQKKRFEAVVDRLTEEEGLSTVMARKEARAREPAPGESDFQGGMCLRLSGDPATFADSRTYSWLKTNMGKYGFIFRYPEYKESSTGVAADLTVIRYVGVAHAAAMQQRSMCLEEYLNYLASQ